MINTDTETASNPEKLERIVIEPLTRVEGHGKVTLLQDEDLKIRQARPTGSCRYWYNGSAAYVR